jgi:hypothetical protein
LPQILGWPKGHVDVVAAGNQALTAAQKAATEGAAKAGKPAPPAPLLTKIGKQAAGNASDEITSTVSKWQEVGGLVGRVLFAVLALWIASRRTLLRIFIVPAMLFVPLLFWNISGALETPGSLGWIQWGIFVAGLLTVAQFSFWGNYIPLVFPMHLRGTGESFAANIGGRVIGTAAAFITLSLSSGQPVAMMAKNGAVVAGLYALAGVILTFWLPEPPAEGVEE